MKNKNILFIILSIVIILVTMVIIKEVIPTINEKNYKTRVFKEMQKKSADVKGYMIPYDIVEENIKEFKSNKKENNDSNKQ